MKKVRIYLLSVCACAALITCKAPEQLAINSDYNYTNKPFQFEATVSTDEEDFSGDLVEMTITDHSHQFNLFCNEGCCNLAATGAMPELNHNETGDPGHPAVEEPFRSRVTATTAGTAPIAAPEKGAIACAHFPVK